MHSNFVKCVSYLVNSFRDGTNSVGDGNSQLGGRRRLGQEVDKTWNNSLLDDSMFLSIATDQQASKMSESTNKTTLN